MIKFEGLLIETSQLPSNRKQSGGMEEDDEATGDQYGPGNARGLEKVGRIKPAPKNKKMICQTVNLAMIPRKSRNFPIE